MILSHRHKFIFIKTLKVGGTSLEVALSKYCGQQDILTPNGSDELRKQLGFMTRRNYKKGISELKPKEIASTLYHRKRPEKFYNHISATEIQGKLDQDIWKEYLKFTVVRNPFDRMISSYYWNMRNKEHHIDFAQYLRNFPERVNENWKLYTYQDKVIVDDFAMYENLEKDLERISNRIGLEENVYDVMKELRTKGGVRPRSIPHREVMGDSERMLIEELGKGEIELFGYTF